jgi:RNA polymerase sigma factor (sigma-70 family)
VKWLPPSPHSFEALYERHRLTVFRLCLRYGGGSGGWAEDVTHDVFIRLLEQLPRLGEHDDLGGWLYRVTSNFALKRLRRDRSFVSRLVRLVQSPPEHAPAPDLLVEHQEQTLEAKRAIEGLPPKERVVMLMKLVDGTSQSEIARALGMSKGNVSKLVARATERLVAAGWELADDGP